MIYCVYLCGLVHANIHMDNINIHVCACISLVIYMLTMQTIPICSRKMQNRPQWLQRSICPPTAGFRWLLNPPGACKKHTEIQTESNHGKNTKEFAIQTGKKVLCNGRIVGRNRLYHAYGCRSEACAFIIALWWLSILGLWNLSTHISPRKNAQFSLAIASEWNTHIDLPFDF